MNRKIIAIFLLNFILLYPVIFSQNIKFVSANPIAVQEHPGFWGHIGILPLENNLNISMVQANVSLNINAREYVKFSITTLGEYIFYNYNQTKNVTVAIPIDNHIGWIEVINKGDIILKINNQPISYQELILSLEQNEYLRNLIPVPTIDEISLIAFNVSFAGYSNTNLTYSFESLIKRYDKHSNVEIYYTVSTGAVWYGNLTERVEFDVYGLQPDDYYVDFENHENTDFQIMDIDDGKKYRWDWINTNYSFYNPSISYTKSDPRFFEFYGLYIILSSIFVLIVLSSSLMYIFRKKKQK
jgi:hypothetical protein